MRVRYILSTVVFAVLGMNFTPTASAQTCPSNSANAAASQDCVDKAANSAPNSPLGTTSADISKASVSSASARYDFFATLAGYITWPEARHRGTFVLCEVTSVSIGPPVPVPLRVRSFTGAELRRVAAPEDALGCHMLWFPAAGGVDSVRFIRFLPRLDIFTVGERAEFALDGGILEARAEGLERRYQFNLEALQRSGLSVSSSLLRLAQRRVP